MDYFQISGIALPKAGHPTNPMESLYGFATGLLDMVQNSEQLVSSLAEPKLESEHVQKIQKLDSG